MRSRRIRLDGAGHGACRAIGIKRHKPLRYGVDEARLPPEIVAKNSPHAEERAGKAARVVAMCLGDRGKLRGKRIIMIPTGNANSFNLQTLDVNDILRQLGVTKPK